MSFPFSRLSSVDIFRFFRPPLDFFSSFLFGGFSSIGVMSDSIDINNKGEYRSEQDPTSDL